VLKGKSKAAKRYLPMVPDVLRVLTERFRDAGRPKDGWVFPSTSKSGHVEQGSAKNQHARALKQSGVKRFEPYCFRHTALTRLAEHCDAFALARIAGHSSITITQRYCHPQADTIERAFNAMAERYRLTDGGDSHKKAGEDPEKTTVTGSG
jgi:integrase